MANAIELSNVHKRYGSVKAVNGISMAIREGEIFGIVGPNGAGKTTTIEMMEGLRKADEGTIRVLGLDPGKDERAVKQRIGIQLQSTSVPEKAKVGEMIKLFASFYVRKANLEKLIKQLSLENVLNRPFKALSGGWKQRVTLALALVNDPEIVFLDEPSMGLDPNARRDMWGLIRGLQQGGRTIVVTTHYMEEAEQLCGRVAVIHGGRLVGLDTADRLIDSLKNASKLRFRFSDRVNPETLKGLPGVTGCHVQGDWIELAASDMDEAARGLFLLAERESWRVRGLRLEGSTMDDVFTELTKKERLA